MRKFVVTDEHDDERELQCEVCCDEWEHKWWLQNASWLDTGDELTEDEMEQYKDDIIDSHSEREYERKYDIP